MKSLLSSVIVALAALTLTLGVVPVAEAKKGFSGGGSFGSKFSQSKPVKRESATPAGRQAPMTPAQKANSERKQQLAQKGGIAGMLGALAIGGLLGALFFGGAFENINFMDILVFGLIAFLLFKLLAGKRRQQPQPAAAGGYGPMEEQAEAEQPYQQRESAAGFQGGGASDGLDALRTGIAIEGFDAEEFLHGAKNCFHRLQRAWAEGDLADIRQFTTDHVFAEIQDRIRARAGNPTIEVVSLEAELLGATDLGSKQEAAVLFTGELIEDGERSRIEEVWHFTRPSSSTQPTWFLEGIQQVED